MLETAYGLWRDRGIDGDILSTGEKVGSYKNALKEAGYDIFHIPLSPKHKFFTKFSNFLIKHNNYDIIHIHSEAASFYIPLLARTLGERKIIRTLHHMWPKRKLAPFIRRYIFRTINNKILNIISVNNSISGKECEEGLFNTNNLLIPNWYNDKKFKPLSFEEKNALRREFDFGKDEIIVTSLGGNWSYKNYDLIIRALNNLSENSSIKYSQVGPQDEEKSLKVLAKRLGVENKIRFWGEVEEVLPLLQLADFYIMPSSQEGFGNAAIEAMSTGLRPILSEVKALLGFKEYYDEGDIIWIQPNIEDITRVFHTIENTNREGLHKECTGLHEKTKRNFGIEVGACQYAELYKSL